MFQSPVLVVELSERPLLGSQSIQRLMRFGFQRVTQGCRVRDFGLLRSTFLFGFSSVGSGEKELSQRVHLPNHSMPVVSVTVHRQRRDLSRIRLARRAALQ